MRKTLVMMIVAVLFCTQLFAKEEAKHALLIANGNYLHFSGLAEPIREAENLRAALEQIGFSVTIVRNASLDTMTDALAGFERKLKESGGIGFFHYGGHAVQVAGSNYLIPTTADIPDERRVRTRALNVDEVMNSMVADTNVVILDSCRNNPLPAGSGRSATRGLVVSSVKPKNSIIVYSAEAGSTAQDGVFTPVLTKEIVRKDTELGAMLMNVRKEVQRLTDGAQTPGEYSQMTDAVYLAGKSAAAAPAEQYQAPQNQMQQYQVAQYQAPQNQMPQYQPPRQSVPNFRSDYEYSAEEMWFYNKYKVDPRNTLAVLSKYKSLITGGIVMAAVGGTSTIAGTIFSSMAMISIPFLAAGIPLLAVGCILTPLCAIPFTIAGNLAKAYRIIYNVELKDAVIQRNFLSRRDSENVKFETAIAFGIK